MKWILSRKSQIASTARLQGFCLHGVAGKGLPHNASLWHCRVEGLKRVTNVAVGEKHSLALQSWCEAPSFQSATFPPAGQGLVSQPSHYFEDIEPGNLSTRRREVHSLMSDAYWAELDASLEEGLPETHHLSDL